MSWNTFVSEDRPRIFNRRADVKVLRLRIVSRDEKETGRVFIVNTGRIHETARAGRFERFRQLANLKRTEVIRQSHKTVLFRSEERRVGKECRPWMWPGK